MGRPKVTEEDLERRVQRIDIEELIEFHSTHTGMVDTIKHFGLTHSEYYYLKKKYNLKVDSKLSEQRRKATRKKLYGDENYNNMEKIKATKLERYDDENYNNSTKQVETCLERWGHDNYNNREKHKETYASFSEEKLQEIDARNKHTKFINHGNPTYNNMRKHIETCKKCSSKPEENMYQKLVKIFGQDDIVRQYYDKDRYPFNCDFYIKSKDLFIEYQGTWTHGGHPFDPNSKEDLDKLIKWESKDSAYYNNAIYTWTILDVKKARIAKENNLNIRFIYPK